MTQSAFDPAHLERMGAGGLKIRWRDGHESLYPWRFLRDSCPCALCAADPTRQRDPGFDANVQAAIPTDIQPVGRYALTIRWSDGHTTGIFSFRYLRSLCPCEACFPQQETEG